ncbi:MAG: SMC-Scp complex subunit ScpB [Spirochaetales bacterium]|nr:SMC-Scp complex subunit ScpB [Spirochaetales bacterium]
MTLDKETALIEAVLFLEAEPIDEQSLCRISGLSKEVVSRVLISLREKYTSSEHGIELIELGGGFLFSPKRELWDLLKERYGKKQEGKLSRAALETLSIIAYSQPITRGEIESIRGVSSDNMIRLLLSKNLIREVGKKDAPGKPVQYGTTKEFLKLFRLKSIADLPRLDENEKERFELHG